MSMPCWATSMSSGSQCQGVLRTILPTGRPMATSPSIRLSTALKDRLNSRSEPKEMHEVAEYGVAAHWAYKKGIKGQVNSKESAIGMNWIKEMMELKTSQAMPKGIRRKCKRRHPGRRDLRLHSRRNRALASQRFRTDRFCL